MVQHGELLKKKSHNTNCFMSSIEIFVCTHSDQLTCAATLIFTAPGEFSQLNTTG